MPTGKLYNYTNQLKGNDKVGTYKSRNVDFNCPLHLLLDEAAQWQMQVQKVKLTQRVNCDCLMLGVLLHRKNVPRDIQAHTITK